MQGNPDFNKSWLRIEIIPGVYQRFAIDGEMTIGREEGNGIFLNAPGVSARHACIGKEKEQVWIKDLDSTNGTFVNHVQISKTYLKDQDCIALGDVKAIFEEQENTFLQKTRDIFLEKTTTNQKRHILIRCPRNVFSQRTFSLGIFIASSPAKVFPEAMEIQESSCMSEAPDTFTIIPSFPGCIVSPCFQEVHVEETPIKKEFWITPLGEQENIKASLHFLQKGKIMKIVKIPFNVVSLFLPRLFFTLAILLPFLGIILDLPSLPINRNLPYMVYSMVSLVKSLGGAALCGFWAGSIFLTLGFLSLWKRRNKGHDLISAEIF